MTKPVKYPVNYCISFKLKDPPKVCNENKSRRIRKTKYFTERRTAQGSSRRMAWPISMNFGILILH